MPRSKNKKPQISLYLLFTIIAFLIITPIYLSQKYESKRTSPVGFKQEQIQDEAKDGVYTNYTYGFRFKYDNKIFNTNNPWDKNWRRFFINDDFQRQLIIEVTDNDYLYDYYSDCKQQEEYQICSANTDKFHQSRGDGDYSPGYGVTFRRNNDEKAYILSISYTDKDNPIEYRKILDQSINSFEFINQ